MVDTYVIGTAGSLPRMYITTTADVAALQVQTGEVCFVFPSTLVAAPAIITSDGTGLETGSVPLTSIKEVKWRDAKSYRDNRMSGSCSTLSGVVQIDSDSQRKINGAVMMAMLAQASSTSFSIDWTMLDNSIATLDASAMIGLGVAVGQYIAACQAAGTAVRASIDAAADQAAVAAVDITSGYPS